MQKIFKTALAVLLVMGACQLVVPPAAAQEDPEARKAKVLANLKLAFPQLSEMNVTMSGFTPSGFGGLDAGRFTIVNQGRPQTQNFLISSDNTKLYLITGEPVDVSRSTEEIQALLDKRAAEAAKADAERQQKLEDAVVGAPTRGNPDASILIVEFSDFQCPYCTRGATTVEQVLEKYGDDVRFVFKHYPLGFHPWAKPASIAAHCAGEQDHDAFWTLHDAYFKNQKQITPANVIAKSKEYLGGSKVDLTTWSTCAEDQNSSEYKAAAAVVDADMALGSSMGVSGTPGFFVNGEFLNGAQPLAAFEPLIQKLKAAN